MPQNDVDFAPTERQRLVGLLDYFIREAGFVISGDDAPGVAAVQLYNMEKDELEWVKCDDPIVLRQLFHLYPGRLSKEALAIMLPSSELTKWEQSLHNGAA